MVVLVTVIVTFVVPSPIQEMDLIPSPSLVAVNLHSFMSKNVELPVEGSHRSRLSNSPRKVSRYVSVIGSVPGGIPSKVKA